MSRLLIAVSLAALLAACSNAGTTKTPSPETPAAAAERFNAFVTGGHGDKSSKQIAAEVSQKYADFLGIWQHPGRLDALSSPDLEALFEAAYNASFYSKTRAHAEDMSDLLARMHKLGSDSAHHYQQLQEGYVRARMFAEASIIGRERGLDTIPEITGSVVAEEGAPTAYFVAQSGRVLERRVVAATDGIVVVSHPNCGFSKNAVRDIEADSQLNELFSQHSFWIAPIDGSLYSETIYRWNNDHPLAQIAIASSMEEWSAIDDWSTPTFYFLRQGKIVSRVVGWPQGGRKQDIINAAKAIGLLP